MEKFNHNGISLAYERHGKGTPLVLIHGYPLDHTIWDEVVPLLDDKFDVILPDVRGFGQSATINIPYTVDDMATDIAGLLDVLGIEKTLVVGHSMGGYIALAFARLYSNRVLGMGIVSCQAVADPPEGKQRRYDTVTQVKENGVGIVADAMTPKLSADTRIQAFVRGMIERQTPGGIVGALRAMAERTDSTSILRSFKFPVVIIHGDADMLIPVQRGREMKEDITHARLFELSGIGHMPMMEDVKDTAEALKSLI